MFVAQWGFLHLKGEFTQKKKIRFVVLNLCDFPLCNTKTDILKSVSVFVCFFTQTMNVNGDPMLFWTPLTFIIWKKNCSFVFHRRKESHWNDMREIIIYHSIRNPHSCSKSIRFGCKFEKDSSRLCKLAVDGAAFWLHFSSPVWSVYATRYELILLQPLKPENEQNFLRPIHPVLVHPAIVLFIDSHPFVIPEGLPNPFMAFQPVFFWLCCTRLCGPARSLLIGSVWSFIFPPSRN